MTANRNSTNWLVLMLGICRMPSLGFSQAATATWLVKLTTLNAPLTTFETGNRYGHVTVLARAN
jgi:hypothetical protein